MAGAASIIIGSICVEIQGWYQRAYGDLSGVFVTTLTQTQHPRFRLSVRDFEVGEETCVPPDRQLVRDET